MSTDAFRAALEELPDPAFCKGRARVKGALALHLPSGEVGKVDSADIVPWLLAHAEDAPFGAGGETRLDPHVRNAKRLRDRGRIRVEGFDPASVIGAIETALSPRMHVDVSLPLRDLTVFEVDVEVPPSAAVLDVDSIDARRGYQARRDQRKAQTESGHDCGQRSLEQPREP